MHRLAALLLVVASGCFEPAFAGTSAKLAGTAPGPAVDTWIVWGDTQGFTEFEQDTPLASGTSDLEVLATWACDRRASRNVKGILGVGDIVQDDDAAEWATFKEATALLDACGLPYYPTVGNHDFLPTVQTANVATDATRYQQQLGRDWLDAKPWFPARGTRPRYVERNSVTGTSLYLEGDAFGSRSFGVWLVPGVLRLLSAEWEWGIRVTRGWAAGFTPATYGATHDWLRGELEAAPGAHHIVITHAGPCGVKNCDGTPEDGGANGSDPQNEDWTRLLDELAPNLAVLLSGHWNRTACTKGFGTFRAGTRDDGTRWLTGGFDFSCQNFREDPEGGVADGNPWTWQGWLQLKRDTRELCVRTVRMLDVDNGGVPRDPAAQVEEYDRGALYGDPTLAVCSGHVGDTGPIECPNAGETCIPLYELGA